MIQVPVRHDLTQKCVTAKITAYGLLEGWPQTTRGGAVQILEEVATTSGITVAALMGRSREPRFVKPRQKAYALLHDMLGWSTPQIGRLMKRDHSTVLYGIRAYRWDMQDRRKHNGSKG